MLIRRKYLILSLILFFCASASSGQAWELLVNGGTAFYSGDLGGDNTKFSSDYFDKLGPAFGLGFRYIPNNRISIQFGGNYASIWGADSLSNDTVKKARNLSFRSSILEVYAKFEFSLINWEQVRYGKAKSEKHNLYIFGGVGAFRFNPQAYYNGSWINLNPLNTEGQTIVQGKRSYALSAAYIMGGFGYRYNLNEAVTLGFEAGFRNTTTDYLDDVSSTYVDNNLLRERRGDVAASLADRNLSGTPIEPGSARGTSTGSDSYFIAQISLAFKIGSKGGGYGFGGSSSFKTRKGCFRF